MSQAGFSVNSFRSALQFGGARPTLFQVQLFNPATSVADIKVPFLAEATQIPESRLGDIQIPFFGRRIHVAGDRVFSPWSIRVINDEDYLIRNALETWSNQINSLEGNLRGFGTSAPAAYKSDARVIHYAKTGEVIRTYKMIGVFPTSISAMEMDYGSIDQIQRFTCSLVFDWFEVDDSSPTGNAGGS